MRRNRLFTCSGFIAVLALSACILLTPQSISQSEQSSLGLVVTEPAIVSPFIAAGSAMPLFGISTTASVAEGSRAGAAMTYAVIEPYQPSDGGNDSGSDRRRSSPANTVNSDVALIGTQSTVNHVLDQRGRRMSRCERTARGGGECV